MGLWLCTSISTSLKVLKAEEGSVAMHIVSDMLESCDISNI